MASSGASYDGTYAAVPRVVAVPSWVTPSAVSGAWTVSLSSSRPLGVYTLSAGVQDQSIAWDVVLDEGTWTFDLIHETNVNRGIYTVALADVATDGTVGSFTDVGTIDGYAGSAAATKSSITGIAVATPGVKRVRLTMATQNVSSSGYYGNPSGIAMVRTA